nr:hypothetical protein BaRGS_026075 [Batillaria attramentaria]
METTTNIDSPTTTSGNTEGPTVSKSASAGDAPDDELQLFIAVLIILVGSAAIILLVFFLRHEPVPSRKPREAAKRESRPTAEAVTTPPDPDGHVTFQFEHNTLD